MVSYANFPNIEPDRIQSFEYQMPPPKMPLFIGSYPPITPAGQMGPFSVNTRFLQPNRKLELSGVVTKRSSSFNCVFGDCS